MSEPDVEYYKRRLAEEHELVRTAKDPKIAALHEELAGLYEKMLSALDGPSSEAA